MSAITVRARARGYTIRFSPDFSFLKVLRRIASPFFLVDARVLRLYRRELKSALWKACMVQFVAREANKSFTGASRIYQLLLQKSIKKSSTLVVIGGGITQDIGGFVAATLFRGIPWMYVPTTLLAQADSCIGGKTALNFSSYKNIVGVFDPPHEIFISPQFLATLHRRDFLSGLGEIAKFELMRLERFIDLENAARTLLRAADRKETSSLLKLVRRSLAFKKEFVEEDEFDKGKRRLLNYGHCFGHALESTSRFAIPHGLAVIIGMMYADLISLNRNLIDEEFFRALSCKVYIPLLERSALRLRRNYFVRDELLEGMEKDKKRSGAGLAIVLRASRFRLQNVQDLSCQEFGKGVEMLQEKLGLSR